MKMESKKLNKDILIKYVVFLVLIILFISSCGGCGGSSNSPNNNNPIIPGTPTGFGNLIGTVTLEDNTDFSGVAIAISSTNTASGTYTASVTTSADGKYAFNSIPAGTYTLNVTKQDFISGTQTLGVINAQTTTGDFALIYTADKRIQQGWSAFTSKNYSASNGSIYYFNKGLNSSPTATEKGQIYTGLSFSYLKQNVGSTYDLNLEKTNITNAYNNANSALSSTPTNNDALSVKVAASINYATYDANPKTIYSVAKTSGETLLTEAPNYSFSYDTTYNYVDIYAYISYACLMIEDKTCAATYSQLALSVEPTNEIALGVKNVLDNLPAKYKFKKFLKW